MFIPLEVVRNDDRVNTSDLCMPNDLATGKSPLVLYNLCCPLTYTI